MSEASPRQQDTAALDVARRSVWIAYATLLALLVISGIWHYLQQHAQAAALLVRILPLVLFLPTLLMQRRRGHVWLTALGVLYVIQGILIIAKGGGSVLVIAEILAASALAIMAYRYVRLRGRLDRAGA
ncbi:MULTISPECIES: DUF2069 domain-containing protein [Salinicola]|uniref:DUF2069 domain-containing protein n=1 Tax=Salinicola socius TaxID=404433 RepID=A0A1Q8SVP6_9GAMM|nr:MULTISPECIES: DUF2069 domain-containing protein [Salinicola]OLO05528.1 hypothetical protein BTW07_03370 [Salinicola socius]